MVAFPGETIQLGVFAKDELGVATSALVTLSDDSIVTLNGSQDMVSCCNQLSYLSMNTLCFTMTDLEWRALSFYPILTEFSQSWSQHRAGCQYAYSQWFTHWKARGCCGKDDY